MTSIRQWYHSNFDRGSLLLIQQTEAQNADGMGRLEFTLMAAVYPYAGAWDAAIRRPTGGPDLLLTEFPAAGNAIQAVNDYFHDLDQAQTPQLL